MNGLYNKITYIVQKKISYKISIYCTKKYKYILQNIEINQNYQKKIRFRSISRTIKLKSPVIKDYCITVY